MNDRGAFIWYELMTDDPAGAKAFYDAVVGWDIQADGQSMPDGSEYRMIGRADGGHAGGALTISEEMKQQGTKPGWFVYIDTADADATAAAVSSAGGKVHLPPTDIGGVGRIAMVSDPWGAAFYIMTPAPPPGQPDAVSDVFHYAKPQHVRWNEVWTSDPPAAAEFYSQLFGWRQDGAMPMGERGDYLFLYRGDGMIGAAGPQFADGRGARWDIYIGVDDIDRAASAVTAGGGELLGVLTEIPGGEFSVHARDPQGAHFGLVGPRTGVAQ